MIELTTYQYGCIIATALVLIVLIYTAFNNRHKERKRPMNWIALFSLICLAAIFSWASIILILILILISGAEIGVDEG